MILYYVITSYKNMKIFTDSFYFISIQSQNDIIDFYKFKFDFFLKRFESDQLSLKS